MLGKAVAAGVIPVRTPHPRRYRPSGRAPNGLTPPAKLCTERCILTVEVLATALSVGQVSGDIRPLFVAPGIEPTIIAPSGGLPLGLAGQRLARPPAIALGLPPGHVPRRVVVGVVGSPVLCIGGGNGPGSPSRPVVVGVGAVQRTPGLPRPVADVACRQLVERWNWALETYVKIDVEMRHNDRASGHLVRPAPPPITSVCEGT